MINRSLLLKHEKKNAILQSDSLDIIQKNESRTDDVCKKSIIVEQKKVPGFIIYTISFRYLFAYLL